MITKNIKKKLDTIRQKHNLSLILLHGSQAKNKTHPKSDLDIAILSKNSHRRIKIFQLITDLSKTFQTDKIDLANLNHADPLLLKTVTSNCQLISGTQQDLDKLRLKTFHRYNNYLPYLKQEQQFVLQNL